MSWVTEVRALGRTALWASLWGAAAASGARTLAMPTLCTGGQGMDPHDVADAIAAATLRRFRADPAQPLRVLVGCYEPEHRAAVEAAKARHFGRLFADHVAPPLFSPAAGELEQAC